LRFCCAFAEYSDGGSDGSLDDVRQHHGIIKPNKSDDNEYLTLYEAHLSRLDEVANPNPGTQSRLGCLCAETHRRDKLTIGCCCEI